MLILGANRYYLLREPTDIRKSFDGLCGLVSNRLDKNPMSGDIFIFINKPRNRMKLLRWEPGGFVLFYKRLERGTSELPVNRNEESSMAVYWPQLMLLEGMALSYVKTRKRYLLTKTD